MYVVSLARLFSSLLYTLHYVVAHAKYTKGEKSLASETRKEEKGYKMMDSPSEVLHQCIHSGVDNIAWP